MVRELAQLQRDPESGVGEPAPAQEALPVDVQRVRTFDTPEFAGMRFLEVETKSALNRVQGMPFSWSINPYRGCSHACAYCFARPSHAYLNLSPGEDFDKTVVVKTNVAEVLRREVAKPSWTGEHVAMGTNTDPYQRAEGRYRLMPGVIDALAQSRTPFSILTKGTLITRDTGRLVAAAQHVPVSAAFTVGMLDEGLWHEVEPGTPTPRARLQAVRALNDAGIPTGVMLAPIMPGLNDDHEQLDALVSACVDAGATHITPIALHLRTSRPSAPQGTSVREVFWPWLASTHPELEGRYRQLYGRAAAADASWREPVERFVAARREAHWRERGRPAQQPAHRRGHTGPAETAGHGSGEQHQQLTLL